MKNKKKLIKIAKSMFKKSLRDGFVDPQKARQVLKETTFQKFVGLTTVLKIYKRLIDQALVWEEITVESATPITNQKKLEEQLIAKTGARKVRYKINPKVIYGAKIIHGDWVYDATFDSKLKQIQLNI